MGQVFLSVNGYGSAYVDNYFPSDGEIITLDCIPDKWCELEDIIASDSYDHIIALPVVEWQEITFNAQWNNLYLEVYFSDHRKLPFWLLAKIKDGNSYVK